MTSPTPHPIPAEVLIHLGPCPDLPGRFGARLAAAGGHAQRGSRTTGPIVRLPFPGNGQLLDDLVRAYPAPVATTIVVTGAQADGLEADDVTRALRARLPTVRHPRRGPGGASGTVTDRFAEAVAGFDWEGWLARPPVTDPPAARSAGSGSAAVPAPLAPGLAARRAARPDGDDGLPPGPRPA